MFKMESEKYLSSLEAKLTKLRGQGGEAAISRDIVTGLSEAKSRQMLCLSQETNQLSSAYVAENDVVIDSESISARLQRRLQPDKQAMSTEELKELLDNDELAKVVASLNAEEENQANSKKEEISHQDTGQG